MHSFHHIQAIFCILITCISSFSTSEICVTKVCEYNFVIRETRTMMYTMMTDGGGKVSYPVRWTQNGSYGVLKPTSFNRKVPDISVPADKVHTADGHTRTIITINDQFPGPAIEVTEGAQVVVTVVNELQFDGITVHFHGMHMKYNPWMDGTAHVTQCPIRPKERFQYRFIASPAGTHWYHSHLGAQRSDGLFGPLIVHRSLPRLPSMTMMIHDWYSIKSSEILLKSPYFLPTPGIGDEFDDAVMRSYLFDGSETSPLKYWSSLINGKGRHGNNTTPLSVFTVKPGHKHRIHLIFSSLEYFHRFSIDQHQLTVIESDGHPIKPVTVDSLIGFMGERFVVEITANQTVGQYWIRASVIRTGTSMNPVPDGRDEKVLAILHYDRADNTEPKTSPRTCTVGEPCKDLNCAWSIYHRVWYPNRVCIPLSELKYDTSIDSSEKPLDEQDVHEIFLNFAFPIGSSINHHRNVLPRGALFQEPSAWGATPCQRGCEEKGCLCTHVINLPVNKIIQLVMTSNRKTIGNEHQILPKHHPIHIHGYSFQVVKMGFAIVNNQTGRMEKPNPDIVCENDYCSKQHWTAGHPMGLNLKNPPVKDTVVVPAWGYTVVRFTTDNPGYWLVHCHQVLHHMEGMSLIFNVSQGISPPPANFPTCKDFSVSKDNFNSMMEKNRQCALDGKCLGTKGQNTNSSVPNGGVPIFLMALLGISSTSMMTLAVTATFIVFFEYIC